MSSSDFPHTKEITDGHGGGGERICTASLYPCFCTLFFGESSRQHAHHLDAKHGKHGYMRRQFVPRRSRVCTPSLALTEVPFISERSRLK